MQEMNRTWQVISICWRFEWIAGLQAYLEKKFDRKIELVRKSENVNRRFIQRIENEVIYVQ